MCHLFIYPVHLIIQCSFLLIFIVASLIGVAKLALIVAIYQPKVPKALKKD